MPEISGGGLATESCLSDEEVAKALGYAVSPGKHSPFSPPLVRSF